MVDDTLYTMTLLLVTLTMLQECQRSENLLLCTDITDHDAAVQHAHFE